MQKKLHKFELAALANLCPESAEEVSQFIVQKYFFCTFPNFFADNDMVLDTWLALKQISLSTGWMVSDLIITICFMLCSFCRKLWTYRYTRYIFLCHDDPCFLLSGPQFNTQSGGPLLRRRARQADPSDLSWRYNCVVGTYYRTQRSGSSPPLLSSALCHLF